MGNALEICAGLNIFTGTPYSGANEFLIPMYAKGMTQAFATFKQFKNNGFSVKKGEKSTPVFFYKFVTKKDENGDVTEGYPCIKKYNIFSIDQVDGADELRQEHNLKDIDRLPKIEAFISNTQAEITQGGQASYCPTSDIVTMPSSNLFESSEGYYSTIIHELAHWTGHRSRLDRFGPSSKKQHLEAYAKEELIAELVAAVLGDRLGLGSRSFEQSAAHFNSWRKSIKANAYNASTILTQASKAAQLLESLQKKEEPLAS